MALGEITDADNESITFWSDTADIPIWIRIDPDSKNPGSHFVALRCLGGGFV